MRILSFIVLTILSVNGWAQELKTEKITDWNTLRKLGFYESNSSNIINTPTNTDWFWGINIAHSTNADAVNVPYHYGAQILFPIKNVATMVPEMYIRSINKSGEGMWAKVLHNQGDQSLNGNLVLRGTQTPSTFGEYGSKLYFGAPYENTDDMWLSRFNVSGDVSELRLNLGDYTGDRFMVGVYGSGTSIFKPIFTVHTAGYITLGDIVNPPVKISQNGNIYSKSLDVAGTIRSKEIKIEATGWSDFVFNEDYNLKPLPEVETHIKEHKHLPEIPSEKEVLENGVNVADMQAKLLQKIEELTLYIIEQDKQNKDQQEQIDELKVQLKNVRP
jgi:hypothetical protein